ncbi:MAG TPA: chemotaxis protein CheW [Pyrinomonadaceae bacterium]
MTTERNNSSDATAIRLLRVDTKTLGVREDVVLTVINWTTPTPLPFSPNTVHGIVSVQGRMFTVVDLRVLLDGESAPRSSKQIVALRGDEQLALAVDDSNTLITADYSDEHNDPTALFEQEMSIDGKTIHLLNPAGLFNAVMKGRERRKRRL